MKTVDHVICQLYKLFYTSVLPHDGPGTGMSHVSQVLTGFILASLFSKMSNGRWLVQAANCDAAALQVFSWKPTFGETRCVCLVGSCAARRNERW